MARTTKTSKKAKGAAPIPRTWEPHPEDAIRLAAMRWFALELERLSIEVYASDRTKFAAMEKLLRYSLRELGRIGTGVKRQSLQDEDCPVGYVLCKDGLCAPMCDWVADENN